MYAVERFLFFTKTAATSNYLTAPRSFHRQLHSSLAQLTICISINDPYDDKAGASSEEKLVIDLD